MALAVLFVSCAGVKLNDALLGVVTASPEAFKTSPRSWAAALNQDGTINSASNHAKLGSIVSVFATGFGALVPPPTEGRVITGTLRSLSAPVQVLYDGLPLEITYAGPAPALVAGVTFRLPTFTATSEPVLQFLVGGWPSGNFVVLVK